MAESYTLRQLAEAEILNSCRFRGVSRTPEWMPRISEFYGIVITMNWDEHLPPHFHAKYAEFLASITIRSRDMSEGRIPPRQLALVRRWARLHEQELLVNWERARQRLPLNPIKPLV